MKKLAKSLRCVGLTIGLLAILAGCAACQAQNRPTIPDPTALTVLIRNSLVALNNANLTGNYTVLRDLGSPEFRKVNTSARLAGIFAPLRARGVNIGPIALFTPQLTRPAAIDDKQMLRLTGFFPTQPSRLNFDLSYQQVDGAWRLFEISINTSQSGPSSSPKQDRAPATQ